MRTIHQFFGLSMLAASAAVCAQQSTKTVLQFSGREVAGAMPLAPQAAPPVLKKNDAFSVLAADLAAIDPAKSLMVTALTVVEDTSRTFDASQGPTKGKPDGPWAFGSLIRQLARQDGKKVDPVMFLQRLLGSWSADAVVNGETVAKRERVKEVMDAWKKFSGATLDVSQAPFRLLAIVNRVDLRSGEAGNAGEARFVFGAIDASGKDLPFTLIFEYGVSVRDFAGLKDWAQRWAALSSAAPAAYNAELEKMTKDFTTDLGPIGTKPVAARLNQIRTNERAIGVPWQLREFNIDKNGLPILVTVKKTPQDAYASDAQLRANLVRFLKQNAGVVTTLGALNVPLAFEGRKMLAGKTDVIGDDLKFVWNPGAGVPEQVRRAFSLNTCNGCHSGETLTRFTHVEVRAAGQESQLSGFLKGIKLNPLPNVPEAEYADLERRRQDLSLLISPDAATLDVKFAPLRAVH